MIRYNYVIHLCGHGNFARLSRLSHIETGNGNSFYHSLYSCTLAPNTYYTLCQLSEGGSKNESLFLKLNKQYRVHFYLGMSCMPLAVTMNCVDILDK